MARPRFEVFWQFGQLIGWPDLFLVGIKTKPARRLLFPDRNLFKYIYHKLLPEQTGGAKRNWKRESNSASWLGARSKARVSVPLGKTNGLSPRVAPSGSPQKGPDGPDTGLAARPALGGRPNEVASGTPGSMGFFLFRRLFVVFNLARFVQLVFVAMDLSPFFHQQNPKCDGFQLLCDV